MKNSGLKNSFKTIFQRYILTNGYLLSYDLIDIANKSKILTFDEKFLNRKFVPHSLQTPFKEIKWATPYQTCNANHLNLLKKQIPLNIKFNDYIKLLKTALRKSILNFWNPKEKYLMSHSTGFDSRIISATLAELRDEGSKIDNIHFRCCQPECPGFFKIMEREGWRKDQYSCYPGRKEDYYNIGISDVNVNGFYFYTHQINAWSDIIPKSEEKDWILMLGFGGEVFRSITQNYKSNYKYCDNLTLTILLDTTVDNRGFESQFSMQFKDLFLPFWSYDYLEISTKINPKWCVWNKNKITDNIRLTLSKSFSYNFDDIPWCAHNFIWRISGKRKKEMMNLYYKSKFYKKYKITINPIVHSWDAKIWAFAVTVYEKIY